MKEALIRQIEAALDDLLESSSESIERPVVALEVPRQAEHGDFSSNIAMLLAKPLKSQPRKIADDLRNRLADGEGLLEAVEIAGPRKRTEAVTTRQRNTKGSNSVCGPPGANSPIAQGRAWPVETPRAEQAA